MKIFPLFFISFTSLTICIACSKKNDDTKTIVSFSSDTSLKQLPFPFGFAVNVEKLSANSSYKNIIQSQANSITAETVMKIAYLHPAQNSYVWKDADTLVAFALRNSIRIHGHTLIWYQSLPSWITNFSGDSTAWENLMKTYIQTVVTHFKGKVTSWDVVNEALSNDGTGLRTESIWYQKLGAGYIARAFQYAHEADPSALLFYNDYGNEWGYTKRNAILNLVNDLKAKCVPIDGIGMQMHTSISQSDANLQTAISTAALTGLKVHISELDISLNVNNDQTMTYNNITAQQQSDKYKVILQAYNSIPKSQQYGITTWGVSDADTWITGYYNRPDWPLLFNGNYQKKMAFYTILDAFK